MENAAKMMMEEHGEKNVDWVKARMEQKTALAVNITADKLRKRSAESSLQRACFTLVQRIQEETAHADRLAQAQANEPPRVELRFNPTRLTVCSFTHLQPTNCNVLFGSLVVFSGGLMIGQMVLERTQIKQSP